MLGLSSCCQTLAVGQLESNCWAVWAEPPVPEPPFPTLICFSLEVSHLSADQAQTCLPLWKRTGTQPRVILLWYAPAHYSAPPNHSGFRCFWLWLCCDFFFLNRYNTPCALRRSPEGGRMSQNEFAAFLTRRKAWLSTLFHTHLHLREGAYFSLDELVWLRGWGGYKKMIAKQKLSPAPCGLASRGVAWVGKRRGGIQGCQKCCHYHGHLGCSSCFPRWHFCEHSWPWHPEMRVPSWGSITASTAGPGARYSKRGSIWSRLPACGVKASFAS